MAAAVGGARDFPPAVVVALSDIGAVGIVIQAGDKPAARLLTQGDTVGAGPFRVLGDAIVERLTSGTTGEPKRIQVPAATFQKALELGARSETDKQPEPLKVKRSPTLLLTTFSHSGGLWGALLALNQARPVELFDKFDPHSWADAVERGNPR